jgi:uncharacterized protein YprB with RNaseH-like and TPR domain
MSSLADKLKSLGVRTGAQDLQAPDKKRSTPIDEIVDGRFIETPYGLTFVIESNYPGDYSHGPIDLNLDASFEVLAAWLREPGLLAHDFQSLVFLDTETSGLSGGTGTYAFLIGIGRFNDHGFHLSQFFMLDPSQELPHLAAVMMSLHPMNGLVTFNGKAFDIPLLNTRYRLNRELSPFQSAFHVDLLPLARRLWRARLPSRTLGYLEENVLFMKRTQDDIPGWMIPGLYFDYLRTGDAQPLKNVFYHNAMDILSMAILLKHIAHILADPFHGKVEHGLDLISIGSLYEEMGELDSAARCYEKGLSFDLPEQAYNEALMRWSLMEKRRQNLEKAVELWVKSAARRDIYGFVELAKFYEHRLRDYEQAMHWTREALDNITSSEFPSLDRHYWLPELEHRLDRLLRKLG